MIIGYARASTADQTASIDTQTATLEENGASKVFAEIVSGKAKELPERERCLEQLRSGDTLLVTRLDRLGRSMVEVNQLIERLLNAGVSIRFLSNGLNLEAGEQNATTRLMVSMLSAIADFETEIRKERQREGIAAAKVAGKYSKNKGRNQYSDDAIKRALENNNGNKSRAARELGMSYQGLHKRVSKWVGDAHLQKSLITE